MSPISLRNCQFPLQIQYRYFCRLMTTHNGHSFRFPCNFLDTLHSFTITVSSSLLLLLNTLSVKILFFVFFFSSFSTKTNDVSLLPVTEPLLKISQKVSLKPEAIRDTKAGELNHGEPNIFFKQTGVR